MISCRDYYCHRVALRMNELFGSWLVTIVINVVIADSIYLRGHLKAQGVKIGCAEI